MPLNLRQLTSFRIFAAAWVVLFHYWPDLAGARPAPAWVARGYLGVEAFFVLSGFILSHVYLQEEACGGLRYRRFLWARLARIYPTHLFTLAAVIAMGMAATALGAAPDHGLLDWRALPANLTLTQAWGLAPSAAFNHPSWSISAEWFAYLLFPAVAWTAWRLRQRPVAALLGALALVAAAYPLFARGAHFPLTQATIAWGALRIVPPFLYGCALHLVWRAGALRSGREARLAAGLFLALTLACVTLGAPDGAVVAALGGLVLCLAELGRRGSRVLAGSLWVHLGEASFALYMVCIPWRDGLAGVAQKLAWISDGARWPAPLGVVLVVGALLAALATHHLVERPARRLLREWGGRRRYRPLEDSTSQCDNRPREVV